LKIKEVDLIPNLSGLAFIQALHLNTKGLNRVLDMEVEVIVDRMGNVVHLPSEFVEVLPDKDCIDESLAIIFLKPAMIIMPTQTMKYLYHLRAVGWGTTILFKSEWQGAFWLVTGYVLNPEIYFIGELLQSGKGVTFSEK